MKVLKEHGGFSSPVEGEPDRTQLEEMGRKEGKKGGKEGRERDGEGGN